MTSQSAAFAYFRSAAEAIGEQVISIDGFEKAVHELGMTGEGTVGLTVPEIAELHASLFQPKSPPHAASSYLEDFGSTQRGCSGSSNKFRKLNSTAAACADMCGFASFIEFREKVDVDAFDRLYATIAGEMGVAEKPWHPALLIAAAAMLPSSELKEAVKNSPGSAPAAVVDLALKDPDPRDDTLPDLATCCFDNIACSEAWLEPSTLENGSWDHSWDLSDHALVAAELELF